MTPITSTTDSRRHLPIAANLLAQNFVTTAPNTIWLTDITYIATALDERTGNCYDNAPMESFFHTRKVELVHQCRWAIQAEARQALFG